MHQYLFPFYKYKLHDKNYSILYIFHTSNIYIYTFILMCRNTASYLIFSSSDLLTDEDLSPFSTKYHHKRAESVQVHNLINFKFIR